MNPDLDFYVEIYDPKTGERFDGDDTECKITILDEDFPGKLSFFMTEVQASKTQETVQVIIKRVEGSSGKISCTVRTEPFLVDDPQNPENAIENEDYIPLHQTVVFESGEIEKIVTINLIDAKVPKIDDDKPNVGIQDDGEEEIDENEDVELRFRVIIENPSQHVKISKKNCCVVSINQSGSIDNV